MTIEPKSYLEKKGLHAFLDFENSALDVEDAVISFGNWDRVNLKWNQAYLTSNETKALCLSMVTYFKAYDPEFAAQLEGVFSKTSIKNGGFKR
jgi:hypothetical protein